jgi:hypothetical protein
MPSRGGNGLVWLRFRAAWRRSIRRMPRRPPPGPRRAPSVGWNSWNHFAAKIGDAGDAGIPGTKAVIASDQGPRESRRLTRFPLAPSRPTG